jgi:hypothetical protein
MFESIAVPARPNWKLRIAAVLSIAAIAAGIVSLWRMTQMPLRSYRGSLPPISLSQSDLARRMAEHVHQLSVAIGERSIPRPGSLELATEYLRGVLSADGYNVTEQSYSVNGHTVSNLEAQLAGNKRWRWVCGGWCSL